MPVVSVPNDGNANPPGFDGGSNDVPAMPAVVDAEVAVPNIPFGGGTTPPPFTVVLKYAKSVTVWVVVVNPPLPSPTTSVCPFGAKILGVAS